MQSVFKILTGSLILVTVGTILFESTRPTEAALATASPSLFLSNCARCHGADGKGLTESGRLYDVPDISGGRLRRKSRQRLTAIVLKGGRSMPAFSKKLTKAEVASIVGYIRRL